MIGIYQYLILLALVRTIAGASTLATQECNPANGKCYHVETDNSLKAYWHEAVATCKANGWRLAEGKTGDDILYFNTIITGESLLNVVQFKWVTVYYGEEVATDSSWWDSTPDNSKQCASIDSDGLEPEDCSVTNAYLCEQEVGCFGSYCYKLYTTPTLSWQDAFDQCATLGYHLVDIGDDTEFNLVKTLSPSISAWVGLRYYSDFYWPYSVEIANEEDSDVWGGTGSAQCARLRYHSNFGNMYKLDDKPCGSTFVLFICEEIPDAPKSPCQEEADAGNSDGWFTHDGAAEYCLIYGEESSTTELFRVAADVFASAVDSSYTVDLLIDEIINDENNMFYTGVVTSPYIQIDLGISFLVKKIHFVLQFSSNCITVCYVSLNGGIITIGDDGTRTDLDGSGTSPNAQCGSTITTDYSTSPDTAIRGIVYTHDCGTAISGQYATLVVAGSNKYIIVRESYVYLHEVVGVSASSPIGVGASGIILNSQMLASSYDQTDSIADYGRIESSAGEGAWIADSGAAGEQWLQVDMLAQTLVSGISTQWSADGTKGVTGYRVAKSYDGLTFTDISVGGVTGLSGSSDGSSSVQVNFDDVVLTRFLRFIPNTYSNEIAMRVEIYGYYKNFETCSDWRSESYESLSTSNVKYWINFGGISTAGFCCVTPDTLFATKGDSWFVFTSSSEEASYPATQVSANTPGQEGCWKPSSSDSTPWVGIELEAMTAVESIEIVPNDGAGTGYYVVHEYTVKYSVDGTTYNWVEDSDGNTRTFFGNTYGEVAPIEKFTPPIFARFFQVYPTPAQSFEVQWNAGDIYTVKSSSSGSICMKVELRGCAQSVSSCDDWMMITGNQAGRYLVNDVATDCGNYIGSSRFPIPMTAIAYKLIVETQMRKKLRFDLRANG